MTLRELIHELYQLAPAALDCPVAFIPPPRDDGSQPPSQRFDSAKLWLRNGGRKRVPGSFNNVVCINLKYGEKR